MAPAETASPEVVVPEFVREASKLARFLTLIIDHFAMIVIIAFVGALIGLADQPKSFSWNVLGWAMYVLYYVVLEYLTGRTIGKLVVGTKVVGEHGRTITLPQILGRTLARYVPFEPLSFFLADRGWHDRWSRTVVVRTRGNVGFR